jgi:hypothetical protein
MFRTLMMTLAAIGGLSVVSLAGAQETPTKLGDAKVNTRSTFYVSGGSCSRSWRTYSKHDSLISAVDAANKLRGEKTGRVVISTGAEPSLPPDQIASSCQLYTRSCRIGWQAGLRTTDRAEAKKEAEAVSENGRDVEIVYEVAAR